MIPRGADLGVCRSERANLRTKSSVADKPIPRWVYVIMMTVPSSPVQVRDLSVLNGAFRGALDCSCGGQVCTNLTQLGASRRRLGLLVVHRAGQRPGYPHDAAIGAGDDLQVHPVLVVLAGV